MVKSPITKKEINNIKQRIKIGDKIRKYEFNPMDWREKITIYNCIVNGIYKHGVSVTKQIGNTTCNDFITYVEIAIILRRFKYGKMYNRS